MDLGLPVPAHAAEGIGDQHALQRQASAASPIELERLELAWSRAMIVAIDEDGVELRGCPLHELVTVAGLHVEPLVIVGQFEELVRDLDHVVVDLDHGEMRIRHFVAEEAHQRGRAQADDQHALRRRAEQQECEHRLRVHEHQAVRLG